MSESNETYVIRVSESGDYFLVPLEFADQFLEDELEGNADYAFYIDLFDLQIKEFYI